MSTDVSRFVDELNHRYEALHTRKEDAFWAAYMGLTSNPDSARKRLEDAEIELQRWLRDTERLERVESLLEEVEASGNECSEDDLVALRGWSRTLRAHAIPSDEGQRLAEEIVSEEGKLARSRASMKLGFHLDGEFHTASSVKLGLMVRNEADGAQRSAAWKGLRSIEDHVLANGFIDVVKKRNRLGKMMGGEDFYDWTVKRVEGLSRREIFALLDELEALTRERAKQSVDELREKHGDAVTPWNIQYQVAGDVTALQDPYFPFARAVDVWMRSFAAMGIRYSDAEMVLDLVDRSGKYENGFMHGPVPSWRDRGKRRAARIQFTANAVPGQVGSGHRALQTLLHEGGHAAHFANIDMPSPCFAQEFAPTSVAFAETQSMFLDSLMNDADWQMRYARSETGESMPRDLIERAISVKQPAAAWQLRAMMVVPYAEAAIYSLPDDELTPERILSTVREIESRFLFMEEGSPRPVLSVPHLLSGESSAYYHGYVLAEMAVYQTRAFFKDRDGHLVDNPRIGPALRDAYWRPGNSRTFKQFVRDLTGEGLTASHLAQHVNRSVDEALDEARQQIERLESIESPQGAVDLNASIRVMHGNETVASSQSGYEGLATQFSDWIRGLEAA
ncbi:MAG: M3 family metallopeptidase [Myxococcota bacterium]